MNSLEGCTQRTCIHTWIEQQIASQPDAIALIHNQQQYSYQQLNAEANRLARHLQATGVSTETLVGICAQRSPQMVIAILAVLKAGGAYVPIDPSYPQERINIIVEDAQLSILIADEPATAELFSTTTNVVCLAEAQAEISLQNPENLNLALSEENLAYVIYTSGSTGRPKGVMIEHRTLINFVQSVGKTYEFSPADNVLQFASISFDISVEEIFTTLTHGATLVLRSQEMLRSTSAFLQTCQDWKISVVDLPTAFWHKLCAALENTPFPENLRLVIIGGERAVPQWLNLWKKHAPAPVRLINTYGPTEATVVTTLCDLAGPNAVSLTESRTLPIGTPLDNVQTYILGDGFMPVRAKDAGELYIGGSGLARGYLNRPDLTQKSYPTVVIDRQSLRLYKTGDLARCREDGHLEFLGRVDHQEKIRGFRVELGEIETVLEQHPKVRQAIVLAREDFPGEKRLVAYVVLNTNIFAEQSLPKMISGEMQSLRDHVRGKLPGYMVPVAFTLMKALPLSANGKIDRRALPIPTIERPALTETYVAPRTPLETALEKEWSKVLGVVHIGVNDNFFDLGGSSLQTMEIIAYVEKKYRVSAHLKDFLAMPSIAGMAGLIGQIRTDQQRPSEHMSLQQLQAEANHCWQNSDLEQPLKQAVSQRSLTVLVPQDIFLTGATGFLGSFLLKEILRQSPTAKIYCLVRAQNVLAAKQRLREALEKYLPASEIDYRRLIPVIGNLTEPNLGLCEQQFQTIARSTGAIYHSGANVNMFYPYTALKSANVGGTQAVLKLATTGPLKALHHISTLDVLESLARTGVDVFNEDDSIAQGSGISGGYAQSKWVAEQLVRRAAEQGLPVRIYRPGMVTGHEQGGESNTNDVFCRFIKSLIQLKSAPDFDLNVDMTPVSYVSRAIARLSLQPSTVGKTFHIVNPHPILLSSIVSSLRHKGYAIKKEAYPDWLNRLSTEPNEMEALAAFTAQATLEEQETCLELWLGGHYVFNCANTAQALADSHLVCPPASSQLLETYLNYFLKKGFIDEPRTPSTTQTSSYHLSR